MSPLLLDFQKSPLNLDLHFLLHAVQAGLQLTDTLLHPGEPSEILVQLASASLRLQDGQHSLLNLLDPPQHLLLFAALLLLPVVIGRLHLQAVVGGVAPTGDLGSLLEAEQLGRGLGAGTVVEGAAVPVQVSLPGAGRVGDQVAHGARVLGALLQQGGLRLGPLQLAGCRDLVIRNHSNIIKCCTGEGQLGYNILSELGW